MQERRTCICKRLYGPTNLRPESIDVYLDHIVQITTKAAIDINRKHGSHVLVLTQLRYQHSRPVMVSPVYFDDLRCNQELA